MINDLRIQNIGVIEDVSLEMLASMVFTQLARRDIFVFDLEIFELVKKKISYLWKIMMLL